MALVMMLLVSLFSLLPRADLVLYAAMHIVCTFAENASPERRDSVLSLAGSCY